MKEESQNSKRKELNFDKAKFLIPDILKAISKLPDIIEAIEKIVSFLQSL